VLLLAEVHAYFFAKILADHSFITLGEKLRVLPHTAFFKKQ